MFSLPGHHHPPQQQHHHPSKHTNGTSGASSEALYDAKYKILTRKCLQVKEDTDRIYSNLLRSKKLLRRLLHERRLLAERLERYGDQFCEVDVPQFCDEDFAYELLIAQKKTLNEVTSPTTPTSSASTSLSRRGSSSSQQIQQTPPLLGSSFFDSMDPASASKGKKGKSATGTPRAKKDPEAPRKPVNAYFIFCERRRADVQRQMVEERQGDVDRKEVTRKLSQLWLDLPQEEKKTFYTLYEIEKSRYDAEMKEYSATRQPMLSASSASTMLMGLPPPFSSAEEEALLNEQPAAKRPKKSGSRNGPGRPPSIQSGSGIATPTVPSADCSPTPSNNDGSNIGLSADGLLLAAGDQAGGSLMIESTSTAGDEPTSAHLHTTEDVFLLDTNGDAMECLGLPLVNHSEAAGDPMMLSSTTTVDESSGGSASGGLGNGNGTSGHHSSSTSPQSGSSGVAQPSLHQGIMLDHHHHHHHPHLVDQPSPPTMSSEWQSLPAAAVVTASSSTEDVAEGDINASSTPNASSSTLSPPLQSSVGQLTATENLETAPAPAVEDEVPVAIAPAADVADSSFVAEPVPMEAENENETESSEDVTKPSSTDLYEDAEQNIVAIVQEKSSEIVEEKAEAVVPVIKIEEPPPVAEEHHHNGNGTEPAHFHQPEPQTPEAKSEVAETAEEEKPPTVETEPEQAADLPSTVTAVVNVADIPLPPEPPTTATFCFGLVQQPQEPQSFES